VAPGCGAVKPEVIGLVNGGVVVYAMFHRQLGPWCSRLLGTGLPVRHKKPHQLLEYAPIRGCTSIQTANTHIRKAVWWVSGHAKEIPGGEGKGWLTCGIRKNVKRTRACKASSARAHQLHRSLDHWGAPQVVKQLRGCRLPLPLLRRRPTVCTN
jgi:hypothetical protein